MAVMFGVIVPVGVGGFLAFLLWVWAVLDCIATDSIVVRNLPKEGWLFVVVFVPTVGALAWLLLGRPENAGYALGGNYRPPDYTQRRPARGFEDSDEWVSKRHQIPTPPPATPAKDVGESSAAKERRLLEWEAELKKRESALGDEPPTDAE